jgi:D-alanyl-D-alanine dipeptidase
MKRSAVTKGIPKLDIGKEILNWPIPSHASARAAKKAKGYAWVPYNTDHPLANDPLVNIHDLGIRGKNFYAANEDAKKGVDPELLKPYLRLDMAQRLMAVNDFLAGKGGKFARDALIGAPGELDIMVEDAYRPYAVIDWLHRNKPDLLRKANPEWSEEQIQDTAQRTAAKPVPSAPHLSGGAVDVALGRPDTDERIANHFSFDSGLRTPTSMQPEDLEVAAETRQLTDLEQEILLGRRVMYWLMTQTPSARGGAPIRNNGEEIWHYGAGDPMTIAGAIAEGHILADSRAYYGPVMDLSTLVSVDG